MGIFWGLLSEKNTPYATFLGQNYAQGGVVSHKICNIYLFAQHFIDGVYFHFTNISQHFL